MPLSPKNSPAVRVDTRPQENATATENLREGIFGSKQPQPQSKSAHQQKAQQQAAAARPRNPLEYNADLPNANLAAQNAEDMRRLQQLADAVATTRRQHHLPPLHPHHHHERAADASRQSPLTQLTNTFNKWRASLLSNNDINLSQLPGRAAAENPVIRTVEGWIDKAQATINNLLAGDAGAGATAGGLAQRRFHLSAARRQQLAFFFVLVLPIALAYLLVFSTYRPSLKKMGWMFSGKNAMGGEGRIPAGAWDDGYDTCWTSKGAARAAWTLPTKFRIDGGNRWVHCDPLQDPQGMCRVGTYEKIGL